MAAALLAAALVALGHLLGWDGVDTPAQVYRVDSLRHQGFSLWDFRWYGGHWTLDYSVLYPTLASAVGILTVTVVSAAVAALAFDRLARARLGPGGPAAAYVFAAGTLVAASIGQLTFLTGEAFGMAAMWALLAKRRVAALILALGCTLTSPLTGAFLALAGAAWAAERILDRDPAAGWGLAMAAVCGVPILGSFLLFPGDGPMPYPVLDWAWEIVVAAAIGALAGRERRALSIGVALYMVAATVSVAVPSALGGNIGRLEDMVALPLAIALAWTRLPLLVPVAALPLALSQWGPAWGAMTAAPASPATHRSFFTPLDRVLSAQGTRGPAGRVEVVPTEWHWEAAWVAPVMPLARGWERQLDEADNPIFYHPGDLNPRSYRAWLLDNAVRFVALPATPLDMAGQAEGRLIGSGRVPGLHLVWQSPQWRLYSVLGAPGIVSGPARLVSTVGTRIELDARGAGQVTVRVRWSPDWYVAAGAGCVSRYQDWMDVRVDRPGPVSLQLSLFGPDRTGCPAGAVAAGH
ncbi:MAG: hypothetical protein M0Z30_13215 [Actinomycetota bacterium]|nr:hypothetical protein [Actinomycetota bacterium]